MFARGIMKAFQKRVLVPSDVLVSTVGGESVILNLISERYFGLDEIGTRMWALLTTSDSIQAAYEILLDEYDVDEQLLRQDLMDLIGRLTEQGLVEINAG